MGPADWCTALLAPCQHVPHADAAFARTLSYLGITPDQLLSDTALLTNVLLYHVLPTRVLSTDILAEPTTVETLG